MVIFLFLLAGTLATHQQQTMDIIKKSFESGIAPVSIWIYVIVAVVSKNIFLENDQPTNFEVYADSIFSIATYGLAGTTSVTLLKGVFLQHFYGESFFFQFGTLDLATIALVSSYLLIYAGVNTTKMFADVIFRAKGVDAKPSDT